MENTGHVSQYHTHEIARSLIFLTLTVSHGVTNDIKKVCVEILSIQARKVCSLFHCSKFIWTLRGTKFVKAK